MATCPLGIQLILHLGQKTPRPAPATVMTALQRVRIVNDTAGEEGFELTFSLRKGQTGALELLHSGLLDPDTRAVIGVRIGVQVQPLCDGVIYYQQVTPAEGDALTLTVMGRGIAVMLDLAQRTATYPNQKASDIVRQLLTHYADYGIIGLEDITPTNEQPSEQRLIPGQHDTDQGYIRQLAERKGFIFYIEPATLGTTKVYWGPPERKTPPLPPLLFHLGPATNVTDLRFTHDPLAQVQVTGETLEPGQKRSQTIKAPKQSPLLAVAQPTPARRTVLLPNAARLGPAAAREAAAAMTAKAPDALTAEGSLDTVRYGAVLRAHRVISVRGAGRTFDGDYLIRQVTHELAPGNYTQRFRLSRKGLGVKK